MSAIPWLVNLLPGYPLCMLEGIRGGIDVNFHVSLNSASSGPTAWM